MTQDRGWVQRVKKESKTQRPLCNTVLERHNVVTHHAGVQPKRKEENHFVDENAVPKLSFITVHNTFCKRPFDCDHIEGCHSPVWKCEISVAKSLKYSSTFLYNSTYWHPCLIWGLGKSSQWQKQVLVLTPLSTFFASTRLMKTRWCKSANVSVTPRVGYLGHRQSRGWADG